MDVGAVNPWWTWTDVTHSRSLRDKKTIKIYYEIYNMRQFDFSLSLQLAIMTMNFPISIKTLYSSCFIFVLAAFVAKESAKR